MQCLYCKSVVCKDIVTFVKKVKFVYINLCFGIKRCVCVFNLSQFYIDNHSNTTDNFSSVCLGFALVILHLGIASKVSPSKIEHAQIICESGYHTRCPELFEAVDQLMAPT